MVDSGTHPVDLEYRKILVIGAKKTGKSSILSTAVGGDFSKAYRPTARCASYYDVEHMLELIDTPGLDDTLLNGTKDTPEPTDFDGVRSHYLAFRDDPIVQELLSEPKDGRSWRDNLLIDVDITTVDAYLIVYTDDDRSKRLAKALRLAILSKRINDNRRAIFLLHHHGDFDTPPFLTRVQINDDTRQMEEERNDPFVELVFRDDVLIQTKAYHHPSLKYVPACSAQTGEGVHRALAVLRAELDRMGAKSGAPASKLASAVQRVPRDLFSLAGHGPAAPIANLRASSDGAGAAAAAGGGEKSAPARKWNAKKPADDDDDDMGAPVTKGQQRAQCTSMAAAACTIQ